MTKENDRFTNKVFDLIQQVGSYYPDWEQVAIIFSDLLESPEGFTEETLYAKQCAYYD